MPLVVTSVMTKGILNGHRGTFLFRHFDDKKGTSPGVLAVPLFLQARALEKEDFIVRKDNLR